MIWLLAIWLVVSTFCLAAIAWSWKLSADAWRQIAMGWRRDFYAFWNAMTDEEKERIAERIANRKQQEESAERMVDSR